MKIPI